tara:strand:- start:157 stop:480 length:324 start_codon:yes stop_codon:yes gene_type:complete
MIRAAKNGCSSEITFKGKKVYHDWENSSIPKSHLGEKLDKVEFLKEYLLDESHLPAIEKLMIDWELYENGWHVVYPDEGYKNEHLFYYLQQMHGYGSHRPKELEYFK